MQLLLNKGELIELGSDLFDEPGIICRNGICWVTVEGDDRDHILRRGDHFEKRTTGRVLVLALDEACLQFDQAQTNERLLHSGHRLSGWQKKRAFYC